MVDSGRRALSFVSPAFSTALLAVLPKCPACLLFLLAPLGIPLEGARWLLLYAAVLLLAAPLVFFWMPVCRKCSKRPLYLALAGSAAMAAGRFAGGGPRISIAGALLILAAVIWASGHAARAASSPAE